MAASLTLQQHAAPRQLGFTADERVGPYAPFFKPTLAPLPDHVEQALLQGAQAHALFPGLDRTSELHGPGYWDQETGYTLCPDGSACVFVLTPMPGVSPAMWDWWFAWHGSEAARYKLWHPRAHVHAAWADGRSDLPHYVGRTSCVTEFIGATELKLTIRFVPPRSLGLNEALLAERGEVAICARGGLAHAPFETGWLIHHVRPVAGGCEMRSRFWIGGHHVMPRGMSGPVARQLGRLASRFQPIQAHQAAELLVHCAQEMNHLAAFLPDLHARFN